MEQAITQYIVANDIYKGTGLSSGQGKAADGGIFSSILLAMLQQRPQVVSMPPANLQASSPSVVVPQKKLLSYPDGKSSSIKIIPGINPQKGNSPDNAQLFINSPISPDKKQGTANQGYGISATAQATLLSIPPQNLINVPLTDQPPLKVDTAPVQTPEGSKSIPGNLFLIRTSPYSTDGVQTGSNPSISPSIHGKIAVAPAAKSVAANSYNMALLNVSGTRQYQIHAAGVYQSPVPEPDVPELFKLQDNNAENGQTRAIMPGPITGARQAESIIFNTQTQTAPRNGISQNANIPLPENAESPNPDQVYAVPSVVKVAPQTHEIKEIPADQGSFVRVEQPSREPSVITPPIPSDVPRQNREIIIPAPDNQIPEAAAKVEVTPRPENTSPITPPPASTIATKTSETFTLKDIVALLSKPVEDISPSVNLRTNTPEAPIALNSNAANTVSVRSDLGQPVPETVPVVDRNIAEIESVREAPALNIPKRPISDTPVPQRELPTIEGVKVSAEVPENAPVREMSAPNVPQQLIPDTHVPQRELPTIEGVRVSVKVPENAPVREMPAANTPERPAIDTPAPQRSESATDESAKVSVEAPEIKAVAPQLAPVMGGNKQDNDPAPAVRYSSGREAPAQHEPVEMKNIPEPIIKGTVEQTGSTTSTPGVPVEQSVWAVQETSEPLSRERKAKAVGENREVRNVSGAIGGKTESQMSGQQLRGISEGDAIPEIDERGGKDEREAFMPGQRTEAQPQASKESVRFAQNNSKMETPKLDAEPVGQSAWLETPGLRSNSEIADITSPLSELPEKISTYVSNLVTGNGANSILIQLEPKHLGKIKFRVSLKGNKISAKLSVDSIETKEMIELQLPGIRRSLTQQAVEVTELSVSMNNGSFGSNLRHFSFSGNSGSNTRQVYGQEDEHRTETQTEQNIMSDEQVNLLI